MKRILLTYTFLFVLGLLTVQAQRTLNALDNRDRYGNQVDPSTQPDSLDNHTDIQSPPPKLYMWKVSENLGNLGSPRLSRVFFERQGDDPTIFMTPFSSFFVNPDQAYFTNSNIPYTNLTYYKAGNQINGEERFKSYFSVNANKALAFGFNIDYLYGRGFYAKQSTSYFNAGIFGSYIGERYQVQAVYNNFHMKMNENGGIENDGYITRPDTMVGGRKEYEPANIPVVFERAANHNKNFYVYLTQRYRLGFKRKILKEEAAKNNIRQTFAPTPTPTATRIRPNIGDSLATDSILLAEKRIQSDSLKLDSLKSDSIGNNVTLANDTNYIEEFVPVTSFIHTFKIERSRHAPDSMQEASRTSFMKTHTTMPKEPAGILPRHSA